MTGSHRVDHQIVRAVLASRLPAGLSDRCCCHGPLHDSADALPHAACRFGPGVPRRREDLQHVGRREVADRLVAAVREGVQSRILPSDRLLIAAPPRNERQPGSTDREVLAGPVERVTFHNADNGFCVLRVKARGHRDLVTVVGHAATVAAGEWITASGEWVHDRTHGQQFRARFLCSSVPSPIEGIEKYLGSGMIRA